MDGIANNRKFLDMMRVTRNPVDPVTVENFRIINHENVDQSFHVMLDPMVCKCNCHLRTLFATR